MITAIAWLKRILYTLLFVVVGFLVYRLLFEEIIGGDDRLVFFLGFWVITAYIVVPKIHRFLTTFYVPDYFIGRVRTGDGLLGDPINCAVKGDKKQLMKAMEHNGWFKAEPITLQSSWRMIVASLTKRSYPTAPVSNLFLFGKQQDIAFQKEVNNNPRARHHVRFWKVPHGWYLPGGYSVDWVGAATFDRRVGISLFTGQITHKIAENTDDERDFVAESFKKANVQFVKHFSTAYHSRNGGGDSIQTDGSLVIINLHNK